MCRYLWRTEEDIRAIGTRVTGDYEPPDVGVGN